MPIIIKEIEVKTVVERELSQQNLSEIQMDQIKRELLRELKDELQIGIVRKKER